jgi:hypothetical protein
MVRKKKPNSKQGTVPLSLDREASRIVSEYILNALGPEFEKTTKDRHSFFWPGGPFEHLESFARQIKKSANRKGDAKTINPRLDSADVAENAMAYLFVMVMFKDRLSSRPPKTLTDAAISVVRSIVIALSAKERLGNPFSPDELEQAIKRGVKTFDHDDRDRDIRRYKSRKRKFDGECFKAISELVSVYSSPRFIKNFFGTSENSQN